MRLNINYRKFFLYVFITIFVLIFNYLFLHLSILNPSSNNIQRLLISSLWEAIGLCLLVNVFILNVVSRPIKEITKVASLITQGDFSSKVYLRAKNEVGDLAKAFNEMIDYTRMRMNEVALEKSRLEAVFLSMFDGILVVDKDKEILLLNQTLKDLFFLQEDLIGKKPLEAIRNVEVEELVNRALTAKEGLISKEIFFYFPQEKSFLIHATAIIQNNRVEGAVLVFHDITELRRLETIRRDFVANVSHELRTPVASIKGYAETLLEGALEDKDNAHDFIKIIYEDSNRLARLIEDLLDLSKIESGKWQLNLKPCKIRPIFETMIVGLKKIIGEKKIAIKLSIPDNISDILADEPMITQAFYNLIDNAIKYNKINGTITIAAHETTEAVQIDFMDTGIGIPEKDISRLFERFYRVDKAHSREIGGTGLGLAIVKHIIQIHHGTLSVESVLSQGSTFSVILSKA